jgi:hypothetical protein
MDNSEQTLKRLICLCSLLVLFYLLQNLEGKEYYGSPYSRFGFMQVEK